jgi:iron complex transport system substrate-binding protein
MKKIFLLILVFFSANLQAKENEKQRLIAIGGDVTEIIYALERQDLLVASDSSSYFPKEAQKLTKIGYQRNLSAEGVLSLKPDLIIVNEGAGPDLTITQIRQANVKFYQLKEENSKENLIKKIAQIGEILGAQKRAKELINSINLEFAQIKSLKNSPKILFLFQFGKGSLMVAGKNTAADAIIKISGAENIANSYSGYKPFNQEFVALYNPDLILTTTQVLESVGGVEELKNLFATQKINAIKNNKIVAMDSLLLLGFTPRLPSAIKQLQSSF